MKLTSTIFLLFILLLNSTAQEASTKIYLFPGQGADYRLYNNIEFPKGYDTIRIHLPVPNRNETIREYATRFIPLIDTNQSFILLGVSLGGMICTELSTMLKPEHVIIISSAKSNRELPRKYTFQKKIPINKIIPKSNLKTGAVLLQPIVEPDSRTNRKFFTSMLAGKDPRYLKRTINMIINWDRTEAPEGIYHIHGTADNTIPYENVDCNYTIEEGSHMMAYTRGDEITVILREYLTGE